MKEIKLSIIIATYNSGKTLKQTLDSIANQTYNNFEVIIIDGASTDNTLEIANQYKSIITTLISEKDTGIYNAFNKGIDKATGDYIAFIGSNDCYYNYSVFERVVDILDKKKFQMISGPVKVVDPISRIEWNYQNAYTNEEIYKGQMLPHAGMFTRTDIMKRFRFNESNRIVSDYEFFLRFLCDGGKVKTIDIPIAYVENGGISSDVMWSKTWCIKLYERMSIIARMKLPEEYLQSQVWTLTKMKNGLTVKYLISQGIRLVARRTGFYSKGRMILPGHYKHKCDLHYCRWCKRDVQLY